MIPLSTFLLLASVASAQTTYYTLTNQQPISPTALNDPASVSTKMLTFKKMSHRYTNPQGASSEDVAKCAITDCYGHTGGDPNNWYRPGGSNYGLFTADTPGLSDQSGNFYYAYPQNSVWYKLSNCQGDGAFLNGSLFLAPNKAQTTKAAGDEGIAIWDQKSGLAWGFYQNNLSGGGSSLPDASNCPGTGPSSCAVAVQAAGGYCWGENLLKERDWGWTGKAAPMGGGNSITPVGQLAMGSLFFRQQEEMQGQVNHAIRMTIDCINSKNPLVFPATSSSNNGAVCGVYPNTGPDMPQRPAGSSYLFFDYTDDQIDNQMPNVPSWAKTILKAISHYGIILGVTGAQFDFIPFGDEVEGGQAYQFSGVTDPWWGWISAQPGITSWKHSDGSTRYQGNMWSNVPNLLTANAPSGYSNTDSNGNSCTSGSGCGVTGHAHILDPCSVVAMAGLSSYTGPYGTVTACPDLQKLSVTINGTGGGTVTSSPSGINCASGICSAQFQNPQPVTLTAAPAAGSTFSGWSGACSGSALSCTVAMSQDQSVTATFNSGSGGVAVAISPTAATVASGGTQQFTATVTGTTNTGVTWTTTAGSISSSGLFTAPAVTANTTVTVKATSVADTTKSASATVTVTPPVPPGIPAFIQAQSGPTSLGSFASVNVPITAASGHFLAVAVGWNDATSTVQSVTDNSGDTFTAVSGIIRVGSGSSALSQVLYCASNIKSGVTSVTVTFNNGSTTALNPDVRGAEYSNVAGGLDAINQKSGTSSVADGGSVTTTAANDLVVGAAMSLGTASGAISPFSTRIISSPGQNILEDDIASTAGPYDAQANLTTSVNWVAVTAAFKSAANLPPAKPQGVKFQ